LINFVTAGFIKRSGRQKWDLVAVGAILSQSGGGRMEEAARDGKRIKSDRTAKNPRFQKTVENLSSILDMLIVTTFV
jgi:hypothetical protein